MMPKKNGVEVFESMKEIDPNVKAILCSGYTSGYKTEQLLEKGVKAFLKKPFTRKQLSKIVYRTINE